MHCLLVVILCLGEILLSPKTHTEKNQSAQANTNKSAVDQKATDPGKALSETQINTNNYQNSEGNETVKNITDGLLALFTLALAVVSVMQWLVLRKHEEWMRKHDANLSKMAQAAVDNAKALVNSNCSLVEVFMEWVPDGARIKAEGGTTEIYINLICSNRGNSPASIVERIIKMEISDMFRGPNLSTVNDSEIDRELIPLAQTGVDGCRRDRRYRLCEPNRPENKYILIYGLVKYRDIFTPEEQSRETWFGFYTTEQDARRNVPMARIQQPGYNRHT
jgi:hypothetical protein